MEIKDITSRDRYIHNGGQNEMFWSPEEKNDKIYNTE